MDNQIKREICILLCHYLKQKTPEIYKEFADFVEKQKLLPPGCLSVNDALNLRYQNFSHDQFYEFIKSLRPKDDFPSVFRRIAPFEPPPVRSEEMAPIKRVYGHRKEVYCLEMDRLSRIIITASDDCTIKVWSIPSIDPIHTFVGHESVITNISMNPMCSMILSSSEDKTICLWSLESGKKLSVLGGFTSEIIHYAIFSPTGSMIAAACEDGTIPIWTTSDALQGSPPIRTLTSQSKGAVGWVSFSPGSEFLAYSSEPNTVVITALKTLTQTPLELHQSLADKIEFSDRYTAIGGELSPRLLTISYEEGVAAIWCIENGGWKAKFVYRHHSGQGRRSSKINRAAWDCEEHLLVIAKTNAVYVCDSINGETIGQIPSTAAAFENTTCVVGNPVKRELFFFANRSGACCLVDVFQLSVVCEFRVADDADFTDAVWDRNGQYVYAIDLAGAITALKLCESKNNVQMIVTDCLGGPEFFVDRQKRKLDRQPFSHDIRTYNIPLHFAQSLVLRNSAIELKLIQRLTSNERPAVSQSPSTNIGPPPLHIRLTTEYPVNPHGKGGFKCAVEDEAPNEEEEAEVHIQSDTDDYTFVNQTFFENLKEDDKKPPTFLTSDSIRKGVWPDWALAISYDEDFFIPQFGDNVVFLKEPYLESLISAGLNPIEPIDPIFEVSSSDANPSLISSPFMKRLNVSNIEPLDSNMLLTLASADSASYRILFPFPETKKFLIPISVFKTGYNLINALKVGENVTIQYCDEKGFINHKSAKIAKIKDDANINAYNSIQLDDDSFISPWNIINIEDKKISYHDHTIIISLFANGIINTINSFLSEPLYNFISNSPDTLMDNSILQKINLPMSLRFMKERLESGWYRSFSGIKYDAKILHKNVLALYGDSSKQAEISASVLKSLIEVVDQLTKKCLSHIKVNK